MLNNTPDLVEGLPSTDAASLLALGSSIEVAGGDTLFRLGDGADAIYVIERGCVALRLPMEVAGHPHDVVVEERGPGQTVGWSGLIPPHRFTLEAVAVVDSVLIALPRAALVRHFEAHPALGWAVTQNLATIVGRRLQVIQAMWLREVQRLVQLRYA
jgi:CRP/FNR family transcriptional regulator, cyclic AMP receptor protein